MSSRRPLLVGAKTPLERRADAINFTAIYVWLTILSLGLGLGLGLYATQKVNPELSMLRTDVDMNKMMLMNAEAAIQAIIQNTTEAEVLINGTIDVSLDSIVIGTTTYRVERILIGGDFPFTWIEFDAFSFVDQDTMGESLFSIQFRNPTPPYYDERTIFGAFGTTIPFLPLTENQNAFSVSGGGCVTNLNPISRGVFTVGTEPAFSFGSFLCGGSPPFITTIELLQPVRILFSSV